MPRLSINVKSNRKPRVKVNRKPKMPSKNLKKTIQKVVDGMSEMKISSSVTNDDSTFTTFELPGGAIPNMFTFQDVLATITQGDGQGQRAGNQIRLKHYWLKMLLTNDSTTINLVGKFVIAKLKAGILAPTAGSFNALFQDGNATDSVINSVFQNYLPFNKNIWDIKKTYSFRLNNKSEVLLTADGLGQYKYISVDIAKYMPKRVQYNDTTADPTNVGLYGFFLMGDSAVAGSSLVLPVEVHASRWAEYYDL